MKVILTCLLALFFVVSVQFLSSCAAPPMVRVEAALPAAIAEEGAAVESDGSGGVDSRVASPPKKRTGIATGWGREMESAMRYGQFERSGKDPRAVALIRYNDAEGAEAMGVSTRVREAEMQGAGEGLVEWGMRSGPGGVENCRWRGDRFVIGKEGRNYQIEVRNVSDARLEVVLSVDGLDVIDGQPASVRKRGYLLEPGKKLVVRGFRTSMDKVAAFKFASVDQSYAGLRHGETRHVGVVGLAVFTEKGREPGEEALMRGKARAFAEAPPMRPR